MRRHKRRAGKKKKWFSDYGKYLSSDLWAGIRRLVLDRDKEICQVCGEKAQCVHHRSYAPLVMEGRPDHMHLLISLCNACHTAVEFSDDGSKIADLSAKEHRLNQAMLLYRSQSLKKWAKSVRLVPSPRIHVVASEDRSPRHKPLSMTDMQRMVESVKYDLERAFRDIAFLRTEVQSLRLMAGVRGTCGAWPSAARAEC